ncbi:Probably subunit of benzoylsuccinyl-CoA thiolase [gamma proteobacterium HdN1]|nr:Probably subunit of benzoylsuccinyl-CoA thiolase [gamma proteobacterium HdN1]
MSTNENGEQKPRVPVLEGWFTHTDDKPHLLGTQCKGCGTYYFPKQTSYCKNPACDSEHFEVVELSRTGKVWSFTNACYQPPEPFVSPDPFVPYTIAAVELEKEKMIVLGQVISGVDVSDLKAGMEMELVLDTLFEDASSQKITWKWQPVANAQNSKGAKP